MRAMLVSPIDLGPAAAEDGQGLVAVEAHAHLGQDAQALLVDADLFFF